MALSAVSQTSEGGGPRLGPEGQRIRAEMIAASRRLHARNALGNARSANFSALLPDAPGHVILTANGLPTGLGEDDFGVVTLDGEFISGTLSKSVQSVIAMHTHAYRRPGVQAVLHTHGPHATAFAVAHKPIPLHYEPMLTRGQAVDVPVTSFGDRDNGGMVDQIDTLLADNPKTRAVLLANHGLLVFHETPDAAADLAGAIDEAAALILRAALIGGSKPLGA